MSNSLAEEQSFNYKSSKEDDDKITCPNCISYGVFENNKLKVPCLNCANDNNFTWGGMRCYGSLGDGEINSEEFAYNIYSLRYQNSHQVFREYAEENNTRSKSMLNGNPVVCLAIQHTTCIDEMTKGIPEEAKNIFMNLVNNHEKEVCDICNPSSVLIN